MRRIFLTIGQNTGILLGVNLTGAGLGFLMAAALGRGLGDAGFGQYSFVMTWLLSLMLLAEFGLSTVLTRDLAAQPEQTHRYLLNSIAGKTVLSSPFLIILFFFAPQLAAGQSPAVITSLRWGIIFFYTGLIYSSFTAIFRAHQRMSPILWLTLSGQTVLLGGTLILILNQQPLFLIIAWAGLSQLLQCMLAFIFYQKLNLSGRGASEISGRGTTLRLPRRATARFAPTCCNIRLKFWTDLPGRELEGFEGNRGELKVPTTSPRFLFSDMPGLRRLIAKAWPFALAGLLAALQLRANSLILAYMAGDQALGWYAAANRFVETGKQFPAAFYGALLPALAALAGSSQSEQSETLRQTLIQARLGLLAFGIIASLGALFLAQPILTLTYGSNYRPATLSLQLLTFTLIPNSQNSILIIYLYACGDEKFVNALTAVGVALNLGLCFWLIPIWGAAGTALALLIAEILLYIPYRLRAWQTPSKKWVTR